MKDSLPTDLRVPLPTIMLRPSGEVTRPAEAKWQGHSQVHSDDDGNNFLIIPCQHMELSIGFGEGAEALPDMERLVKLLQERIDEIKAYEE